MYNMSTIIAELSENQSGQIKDTDVPVKGIIRYSNNECLPVSSAGEMRTKHIIYIVLNFKCLILTVLDTELIIAIVYIVFQYYLWISVNILTDS